VVSVLHAVLLVVAVLGASTPAVLALARLFESALRRMWW
jgi:hypothetical protein